MMTMRRMQNKKRGFALIAVIGVMAVLAVLVVIAAGAVQFNYSFTGLRARDMRMRDAASEAARFLARGGELTTAKETTARIFTVQGEKAGDIEVSATLAVATPKDFQDMPIELREGDHLARVCAAYRGAASYTGTYLVNLNSNRHSPILIKEERGK